MKTDRKNGSPRGLGATGMIALLVTGMLLAGIWLVPPVFSGGRRESPANGDRTAPDKVVIGFQAIPNGEIVAKNLGWVEEVMPVPVQWIQFNSGSELNAAVAAGSVDIGLGGSSTTVAAVAQGVPAEIVWIQNIIGDNEALVVRRDSPIRQVSDLAGRRVAAPFGATTHYHLMVALELAGLDPSELTIMDMTPQDMRAAWQRGDIDAGFVWEPTLAAMLEMDGRVLVTSGEIAAQGYLTGDITIARRGFAERYPHLVEQYLRAQIRAVELILSDPDEAASAIAREFSLDQAEARRQMDSLVFVPGHEQPQALADLADVFVATGEFLAAQRSIRSAPDRSVFADAINSTYVEGALATAP
ncbi:MAG: glycine/betaine ABC transporter substrate-binding protein [Spirochaetaceae bacterium]|nr:MAG: glycine/betaine ABC transporter substrate-binding protein [Spirochaetaceae bacterium]